MNRHDDELMRPGGLEILSTGLNLAELDLSGGEGFWDEVQRYVRHSQLEAQVDAAMKGRAAPRVWAFLESPSGGPSAAAAALGAAWILADRGQAVVLVDADEQEPLITRWLGRTEQEGWIDMIRFGASLHAASDALPSANRRGSVLGVGSFAPTGVNPDEVADLLNRLRRQADDLILVLPAKLRSVPWLEATQIRLLCWDLLSRSAGDTERILAELDRMGARPDALLGFGVEEFNAIQGSLREIPPVTDVPPQGEPVVTGPEVVEDGAVWTPEPEPVTEPDRADPPDQELEPEPVAASADAFATSGPDELDAPDNTPDNAALAADEPLAAAGPGRRRPRTSGVFIVLAVVAVVSLVLLGLFLRGQLDAGRPDTIDQQPPVIAAQPPADPVTPAGDEPAPPVDEMTAPPAGDERPPVEAEEPPLPGAAEPVETRPAVEPAPAPADEPGQGDDPRQAAEPQALSPAFDLEPFRQPAGQDGWTLWLYSFPDEAGAAVEARRLERRGIQTAVRAVDLPEQGRWFRVYAGSFPDRRSARSAAGGLSAELKHDWVVPARF